MMLNTNSFVGSRRLAAHGNTIAAPAARRGSGIACKQARLHITQPQHAPPSRRRIVKCRADVNWDAFGSAVQQTAAAMHASARPSLPVVRQYDFVVIGSGIAGLSYALKVAQYGRVAIITKDYANEGCTQYAQGGVCAVLDATDSVDNHVRDTIVAGAYLNDTQAVEVVCREGPARVLDLVKLGAEFTRNGDGSLHLTREGGHSNRRIVHAADLTGREIERALLDAARGTAAIDFYEHHLAAELVTDEVSGVAHCFGVDVLDQRSNHMCRFIALGTMLASGGAGQVYPNTTNPHVATGDGIAMAYRARARIANMEFVQFHPTALYDPTAPAGRTFLITEAVRGEGGLLFNQAGERFMSQYDPARMELAPRDVVSRSIHDQLLRRGDAHVWLDISHKPADKLRAHFPNIAAKCGELGIDITRDPIPVTPAQHYMVGGVQTGLLGETSIQGLYACGEVTCTGLHGANRLASNSLLEGLVFADRAVGPSVAHAEYALKQCGRQLHYAAASAEFTGSSGAAAPSARLSAWAAAQRGELQQLMWRHAGLVRRSADMGRALGDVRRICRAAKSAVAESGVSTPLLELVNLATVSELVLTCALQRKESRGLHYNADYPAMDDAARQPSVVVRRPAKPWRQAVTAPSGGYQSQLTVSGAAGTTSIITLGSGNGSSGSSSSSSTGGKAKKQKSSRNSVSVRSSSQDM